MVFVSIRGRVLINAEALNMTESVGNYVKHRKVPVISPKTYVTYFVPAISGEAIAHGYQEVLAKIAEKNGLPVCNLCRKGIFLKSTNENVFTDAFGKNVPGDDNDLEKAIISGCMVEDIGGFLYAHGNRNVKRTSSFSTGYMIPVNEAIESVVIEPQLHQRHALGTRHVESQGQMIYYVELSSAPYVFSFDMDTSLIGRLAFSVEHAGEKVVSGEEIKKRKITALDALQEFLAEMLFGAKRTRFLPVIDWESIAIAVSDDIWTVPSPSSVSYILNALNKLEKRNYNTKLFIYINPLLFEDTSVYVKKKTEELLNSFYEALEEFKKKLEERGDADKINWDDFKKRKLEEFLEKKVDEIANSSDIRYTRKIQEKYAKIKEVLKSKGFKIYSSFEECIGDAIEEAKSRC